MFLRFGRWACRRRWLLLGVWAVLLLGSVPVAPNVFHALSAGGFSSTDLEAERAGELLGDRFGASTLELYAVYTDPSGRLPATSDRFKAEVDAVTSPATAPGQVAPDGQAAYATIALKSGAADARDAVARITQALQPT